MSESKQKKYWAFISYSSKDAKWGKWLHKRLENYPIPPEMQGIEFRDGTKLEKRFRPIFRDRDELAGSEELGPAIEKALRQSRYLIVLCSPNSAKSKWVNKEIENFKRISEDGKVLALIIEGEPNATKRKDVSNDRECFPPALRLPMEPLAGDLREEGDGKERGVLKVIAGMAEVGFDQLYRRHERIKRKRMFVVGSSAIAIITALTALTVFAFYQKNFAESETLRANKETTRANEAADLATQEQRKALRLLNQSETENLVAKSKASEDPFVSLLVASEALRHSIDTKVEHKIARNHMHGLLSNYQGKYLHGHSLPLTCVAFNEVEPEDQSKHLMLTGGRDGRVIAWDLSGKPIASRLVEKFDSPVVGCAILDDQIGVAVSRFGRVVALDLNNWEATIVHSKLGNMEASQSDFVTLAPRINKLQFHEDCVVGVVKIPGSESDQLLAWDTNDFHSLVFDTTAEGKCFVVKDRIRGILDQHLKNDESVENYEQRLTKLAYSLFSIEDDFEMLLSEFNQLDEDVSTKANVPVEKGTPKGNGVLNPSLVKDLDLPDRLLAATYHGTPLLLTDNANLLSVSSTAVTETEVRKESVALTNGGVFRLMSTNTNEIFRIQPESGFLFQITDELASQMAQELEEGNEVDSELELPEPGCYWISENGEQELSGVSYISDYVISEPFSDYWSKDESKELWLAVSDENKLKAWNFDNRELTMPFDLGPTDDNLFRTSNNRWLISFDPNQSEINFHDMFSDDPAKRVSSSITFPSELRSFVGIGERYIAVGAKDGTVQLFDTEEFLPEAQRRFPRSAPGPLAVEDPETIRAKLSYEDFFSLVRKANQPGDSYEIFGRYMPGIISSIVSSNGEHCVVNYDGTWYDYFAFDLNEFRCSGKLKNVSIEVEATTPLSLRWVAASNQLNDMIGVDDSGKTFYGKLVEEYQEDDGEVIFSREYQFSEMEIRSIEMLRLSPDGKWLVTLQNSDFEDEFGSRAKIWSNKNGKLKLAYNLADDLGLGSLDGLTNLGTFSQDSNSYAVLKKVDDWKSEVVIYDLSSTPTIRQKIRIEDSFKPVISLTDDGKLLAVINAPKSKATTVKKVQVFDTKSKNCLHEFVLQTEAGDFIRQRELTSGITSIFDISETGQYVAFAGNKGTTVWDLNDKSPHENRWFFENSGVTTVHVSEKFQSLLTLDEHGNGRNWQLSDELLLTRAKAIVNRNFSETEWDNLRPGRPYNSTFLDLPAKPKKEAGKDIWKSKSSIEIEIPGEDRE